jgi:hypothetical protein
MPVTELPQRRRRGAFIPLLFNKRVLIDTVWTLTCSAKHHDKEVHRDMRLESSSAIGRCLVAWIVFSSSTEASQVVITISGTIYEGSDTSGSGTKGLFAAPGTDLTGRSLTLTFTFDDTKGTKTDSYSGQPPVLVSSEFVSSNPGATGNVVLQVGGVSSRLTASPSTRCSRDCLPLRISTSTARSTWWRYSPTEPMRFPRERCREFPHSRQNRAMRSCSTAWDSGRSRQAFQRDSLWENQTVWRISTSR